MFVFDTRLIVGSTNVSSSSENDLIEAAMLCENVVVAKEATDWMTTLEKQKITKDFIERAKKIYRPPRNWKRAGRSDLWILSTCEIKKREEQEEKLRDKLNSQVSTKTNLKKFEIESIRWTDEPRIAENVQQGDRIIQVYTDENDEITVFPPSELRKITHYLTLGNEEKRTFLTIATPKNFPDISWSKFSSVAKDAGLSRISKNSRRSVPAKAKDTLLSLWE